MFIREARGNVSLFGEGHVYGTYRGRRVGIHGHLAGVVKDKPEVRGELRPVRASIVGGNGGIGSIDVVGMFTGAIEKDQAAKFRLICPELPWVHGQIVLCEQA